MTDEAATLAEVRRLRDLGWGNRRIGEEVKGEDGSPIGRHTATRLLQQLKAIDEAAPTPLPEVAPTTSGEFHQLANLFPLIEGDEFADLSEDIKTNGLREPVVIFEGQILDGRNRYRASLVAGVDPTLIAFNSSVDGSPLEFVISKNLKRRHLNESQRAMVGARIANMGRGRPSGKQANLPDIKVPQAAAAKRLSISERAIRAARSVQEHAEPEITRAVDRGHLAVSAAASAAKLRPEIQRQIAAEAEAGDANAARHVIKTEARHVREVALGDAQAKGNLALPNKRYGVVLADPAWSFETWSEDGKDRSADNHYATTSTGKIAALPVQDIAAKDCVLFLWATVPMLPEALHVMAAWGFRYKSHRVWQKDRVGTGYWFRNNHELLLVGTKGDVPAPAMGTQWPSCFTDSVGEHSVKPNSQYELIEAYFPHLPKIELNARRLREGWDSWGLDAPAVNPNTGEVREAAE